MSETLRQYRERQIREIAARYSIAQTEVRGAYPDDDPRWYGEWWAAIVERARDGQTIDAATLDAVEPHNRRYLLHDYPRAVPAGYLPPDVRALNAAAPRLFR